MLLSELLETERELKLKQARDASKPAIVKDDRYEFIEEIARGGAAVVWRVRDRNLQRETAIKYLLDTCDNHEMRFRLEREARLCARLVHPGIVPIHELSSFADGRPFVSMKLVEGKTLLQLVNAEPRPSVKSLTEIFTKACQAMAHAHSKGIIHRDLKPSNIMVGSFGEVQIMDWGLAKELTRDATGRLTNRALDDTVSELTQDHFSEDLNATVFDSVTREATVIGTVCGTIAYMSPEQACGKIDAIDERTDVFALGAVLCRLLIGTPPYVEPDIHAMLQKAQRGEMRSTLQRLSQSPHRKLANLAAKCMTVDADQRPKDAAAVVELLSAIQHSEQRKQHAVRLLVTAVSIVVLVVAALLIRRENQTPEIPAQVEHASTTSEEIVDPVIIQSLFQSRAEEIALKSYKAALAKNPEHERLHYLFCTALMNKRRFDEAEPVARRLTELNANNAEYHYLLGDALYLQGKFEPAVVEILKCKELFKPDDQPRLPVEENLQKFQFSIEIAGRLDSLDPSDDPEASPDTLMSIAKVCELRERIELAMLFTDTALERITDDQQRSYLCFLSLAYLASRQLERDDLAASTRNAVFETALKWLEWQIQCAMNRTTEEKQPTQHQQLVQILKTGKDMRALYEAAEDERVDLDLRNRLKKMLAEIEQLQAVST